MAQEEFIQLENFCPVWIPLKVVTLNGGQVVGGAGFEMEQNLPWKTQFFSGIWISFVKVLLIKPWFWSMCGPVPSDLHSVILVVPSSSKNSVVYRSMCIYAHLLIFFSLIYNQNIQNAITTDCFCKCCIQYWNKIWSMFKYLFSCIMQCPCSTRIDGQEWTFVHFLMDISIESAAKNPKLLTAELVLISSVPQCHFLVFLHLRVKEHLFLIDPFIITFLWNCSTLRKPF